MTAQTLVNLAKKNKILGKLTVSSIIAALSVLSVFAADPVVWEGSTNLTMTANTTVEVPAGTTNVIDTLGGAYTLTKTGGGVLEVRYSKSASTKLVISEGLVHFTNPRPDDIFAKAYFHVDASDLSSMVIETINGTNFVKRWNDTDGGEHYATTSTSTAYGRTNPENRLPFIGFEKQNGRTYVDFGSLLVSGYTNEEGVAIGYGAAMAWDKSFNMLEGFSVVSDTPDIDDFMNRYSKATSAYAMSFFSHSSYSGVRGTFYAEHRPYLFKQNGQNSKYYDSGRIYVDATVQPTPYNNAFPAGFHVVNAAPTSAATISRFAQEYAASTTSSYGGTRIAEYVVFAETLEERERFAMNGYLLCKWKPQTLASVTIEAGASFVVDEDVNMSVGIFTGGNGVDELSCAGMTLSQSALSAVGAYLHLDASVTNTMTIVSENGTNFVTRWNDVDGGSMYAIHETLTGKYGQRPNPENRKPFLNPTLTQNGLPVMDLGSAIFSNYTNEEGVSYGYGAAFRYNGLPNPSIVEYLSVISDTEDLKSVSAGLDGPSYVAYYTGNTYNGQNEGRRGTTVKNKNPPMFANVNSDSKPFMEGVILVDNETKAYTYNPPDGFSVVNLRPTRGAYCNLIGRTLRSDVKMTHDTYGGQRIAEYMVFTSVLDDDKRQRIYNALRNKWFGDVPGTTNYYNNLSLGTKAAMSVKYEAVAVTNKLTLAGSIAAPAVSAADVDVAGTNATVESALTISDGATLSFTRLADGSWTSLSAKSIAAGEHVTVSLSAADQRGLGGTEVRILTLETPPSSLDGWSLSYEGRYEPRLSLREDGVWVEFPKPGALILVL